MPDWILLLPIVFPIVSALALARWLPYRAPTTRRVATLGWLSIEIVLVLLNALPSSHRLVLSTWERAALTFALRMDGMTWLIVLIMLVLWLARELIAPTRFDARAMIVFAAALVLAMADGAAMILVAWTIFDLALLAWRWERDLERASAWRSLVIGWLMGLAFFAGALTARTNVGATLLALALWARAGLFPFHALLPTREVEASTLWIARGIPLLAVANVWLHWHAFQTTIPYTVIGVLAATSLIVTALWIWRASDAPRALGLGAMYAFALVPLSLALDSEAGVAFALWQILAIAFAFALVEIAWHWRAEKPSVVPLTLGLLAVCALVGVPLTPAFLGRWGLYVALVESGEWLLLALVFFATLVVCASLWHWTSTLKGSEARTPTRAEFVGLLVALVPFAILAFAAWLITPALGIAESVERALARVVWTNNALGVGIGILVLLLPLVGSYILRARVASRADERTFVMQLARASELEWLERAIVQIGWRASVLARDAFTLAEENPLVWILFAALWVGIFIATAR
ncbi:MAG: hypothetical protein N2559_02160 [Anaerolineae bacterium]|nr:hypothetical protein [Anaerolineae bacterium]